MSSKYPGGIISKTAPTPSGPYANDTAPGVWTLEQQAYWTKLGQWPTAGNVNPDAFIENLFSTYLYTGNGSTQTITNGIDLSGEGGLIWTKNRTLAGSTNHILTDSVSGLNYFLRSNQTNNATSFTGNGLIAPVFNSNGFTTSDYSDAGAQSGYGFVTWTFRKQPKFFDVVTYTGTGAAQTVAHNLGSAPGMVIVKVTSTTNDWFVWHRGLSAGNYIKLNTTDAQSTTNAQFFFGNGTTTVDPSSTVITLGGSGAVNGSGQTYVAYLFAHDAGGFGLTGTDNVISCGSFTTDGNGTIPETSLGYEPQWVMFKASSTTGAWTINDTMRGQPTPATANASAPDATLYANQSSAESQADNLYPTATGFKGVYAAVVPSTTYIYIAIRRGPMAVPTSGTSVFAIDTRNATTPSFVSNFPVDMSTYRAKSGSDWYLQSRLTPNYLFTNSTDAEAVGTVFSATQFAYNTGWGSSGASIPDLFSYMFKRAPSFFDEVCYTGTGSATTKSHNLGVVPELMIVKSRSQVNSWAVYLGGPLGGTKTANLDKTYAAYDSSGHWNSTQPTASVFSIGNNGEVNDSGVTYVAYLFATCAGVSKVGSYTGTGTTLQVDCGFTGGSRFVLIKRTDSTGDWYVWDSARGIVAGNDPYLLLNSAAAEVTGTDYVDTYSAGFEISSTAPSAINASGGTFIFLAIA